VQADRSRPAARHDGLILLVRHGETAWNLVGRQQGHLDSPLTEAGIDQARAAGQSLRQLAGDIRSLVIEASPLGRAQGTAHLIARELGLEATVVRTSPLLIEHKLGVWQGLTYAEIDERYPGARAAREAAKWTYLIEGGESYAGAAARAEQWLASCVAPVIVAVTHEMMSRSLRGAYAGLPPPEILALSHRHDRLYRLQGGAIAEIVIAPRR